MTKRAFEERFGVVREAECNWTKRYLASEGHSIFPGTFFTGGIYLRPGMVLDELPWGELAADVARVTGWKAQLTEANAIHSNYNDNEYYPLVLPRSFPGDDERTFFAGFLEALGLELSDFRRTLEDADPSFPGYPQFPPQTFFSQQAVHAQCVEDGLSAEEIAEEYVVPAELAVCERIHEEMKAQLKHHREFALITGYDWFIRFSVGQSETGRWIGFFVPISDVGFMYDYQDDGFSLYG